MTQSCVTFVTCYMNLYDEPFEKKDVEWRFGHFRKIARTGIQLCVFCSPDNAAYLENFAKEFPYVRIMKYIAIQDTWSYNLVSMLNADGGIELPVHRNEPKDTVEYICMMHSKVEFLNTAIAADPFGSTHFAWIDFNIAYIFKDNVYVEEYLRVLAQRTFVADFLAIPGCWEKQKPETCLLDNICWRFCGGFFIGSKDRVLDFYTKYVEYFPMFLETHRKLIWEVNFWAWLETNTDWTPIWFKGDHNDSIIQITTDICNRCLYDTTYAKMSYFYPPVETYEASSASHTFYRGQHILNTRYVNYWYRPSGHCNILHPHNWIISKNFMSVLDYDKENKTLEPTDFVEMDDSTIGLETHDACFFGLEDIRLYVLNDEIRFICTNINYSPTGRNRMISGRYHIDSATYSECRILNPPNKDSWCEKNWIPLIRRQDDGADEEFFIYKWWPFEVGRVNRERDQLEIILSYKLNSPLFMKVRGSTAFVDTEEGLVGLVHYSEDTLPRHYYHIIVLLDKTTFMPLRYSDIFCFEKIGIEFCIGFWLTKGEYHFWISRMDRDPLYLKMREDELPLKFDFSIL